jgi:SNF2 family DNA or RNA helicase
MIQLRPHQIEAIEKMRVIDKGGLGGVLSHEMGLGKSICFASYRLQKRSEEIPDYPDLIVCPLAVLTHWKKEIHSLDPNQRILIYHGPERRKYLSSMPSYDFIICTYHCLVTKELENTQFECVVLDEAHVIRNGIERKHSKVPKTALGAFGLKKVSKIRWCITGTPFNNRIEDIQSLMVFLGYPLSLNVEKFVESNILQKGKEGIIKPYITHLVPVEILKIESKEEKEIVYGPYDDAHKTYYSLMEKMKQTHNPIESRELYVQAMGQLTKMRVFCDLSLTSVKGRDYFFEDPSEDDGTTEPDCYEEVDFTSEEMLKFYDSSPKIKAIYDHMIEWLPKAPKRRILIFSSFTTVLNILEHIINKKQKNIKTMKYTGQMNRASRDKVIETFTDENSIEDMVMLASLGAGNCGINLVPCATVFIVDICMNPFEILQGINRVHRLTQTNQVNVFKFYMKGLIEENILQSHNTKIDIASDLGLKNDIPVLDLIKNRKNRK